MMVRLLAALALSFALFAAPAQANLLTNSSFELPSGQGWKVEPNGAVDVGTLTTPGVAREGAGFGVARTGGAGRSFAQDIGFAPVPGRSYSYSVWVRSADGQPFRGRIALWGVGQTASESSVTDFTAGGAWTLVSAPLSPTTAHDFLRAEIYLLTSDADLYVDGAQVIDSGLANASFEQGFGGWSTQEGVGASAAIVPGAAREGNGLATVGTGIAGRSFYQDAGAPAPGQTWVYSAWVRSVSGRPFSGQMTVWALGGTQEAGSTQFTADGNWTLVSAPLSVVNAGHTALRAELYLNTVNENLQVDGAQLVNTGLANASFELANFSGWNTFPYGALTAATSARVAARASGSRPSRPVRPAAPSPSSSPRPPRARCSRRGCARPRTRRWPAR